MRLKGRRLPLALYSSLQGTRLRKGKVYVRCGADQGVGNDEVWGSGRFHGSPFLHILADNSRFNLRVVRRVGVIAGPLQGRGRKGASGRSRRAAGYPQIAVVLAVHLTSPGYGAARLLPVVVVEEAAIV